MNANSASKLVLPRLKMDELNVTFANQPMFDWFETNLKNPKTGQYFAHDCNEIKTKKLIYSLFVLFEEEMASR